VRLRLRLRLRVRLRLSVSVSVSVRLRLRLSLRLRLRLRIRVRAATRRARRQQCGDGRREGLRVARAQACEREWEGTEEREQVRRTLRIARAHGGDRGQAELTHLMRGTGRGRGRLGVRVRVRPHGSERG